MSVAAVVPVVRAEQDGSPDAFGELRGLALLGHAIGAVTRASLVDLVLVATPPDDLEPVRALLDRRQLSAQCASESAAPSTFAMARQAVTDLPAAVDIVLLHDATRPLVPPELVDAVVREVRAGCDAVLPAMPVADTIKQSDANARVLRTVDRGTLRTAQSPRGFRREVLCKAYASEPDASDTDELGLVRRVGGTVVTIPGAEEAFRVTGPADLALADVFMSRRGDDRG
ncbi:MAG: IspD/TarI family cytidylyltransferase [Streptosporangiales bacterium]